MTTTAIIKDARKFANNIDQNQPLVITSDTSQGNFHSVDAALTWLKLNNQFTSSLVVRGSTILGSLVNSLDFSNKIEIVGDGYAQLTITDPISIGSNITFKNISFNLNVDSPITITGSNVGFFNCTFSTIPNSGVVNGIILSNNASNFILNGCKINYDAHYLPFGFERVSNGAGFIYSEINSSNSISNILITKNIFSMASISHNKYSYINFNITDINCGIDGLEISYNTFNNQGATDFTAAIAIINSKASNSSTTPQLKKCKIIKNNIVGDQLIVLTSVRVSSQMVYPGLICNDTIISENTVGVIGFMTSARDGAGSPSSLLPNSSSIVIEKNNCKYICNMDENGAYFEVYNNNSSTLNQVHLVGSATISNNNCSFIHVGAHSTTTYIANINIINNSLSSNIISGTAHNIDYLNNFNYPTLNKRYAIYVSALLTAGSNVLIDGNITGGIIGVYESYLRCNSKGIIINNSFSKITTAVSLSDYEYSCIVFDGVEGLNGGNSIIKNNYINRGSANVFAFISSQFTLSSLDTTNAGRVIVQNNIFDSTITNGSDPTSTILVKDSAGNDASFAWIVKENINQTGSLVLQLPDSFYLTNLSGTAIILTSDTAFQSFQSIALGQILPYGAEITKVSTTITKSGDPFTASDTTLSRNEVILGLTYIGGANKLSTTNLAALNASFYTAGSNTLTPLLDNTSDYGSWIVKDKLVLTYYFNFFGKASTTSTTFHANDITINYKW